MRKVLIACAAIVLAGSFAGPGWAVFKPRPRGPESCSKWDCEGGIICSCCFAGQGCWICDSTVGKHPDLNFCHFDPKISSGGAKINPNLNVTPIKP